MRALKEYSIVEYLDISGNGIGKTSYAPDCAESIYQYLN